MSHTSSIKSIKIVSIPALRAAVAELNRTGVTCELVADATPRAFFENQEGLGRADYVLKLAKAKYDIGLYKVADGSYEARTDFWGGSVEQTLGARPSCPENAEQAKMGKLFQLYGIHAATETARRKGLSVRRIEGKDGKVRLELTGAAL